MWRRKLVPVLGLVLIGVGVEGSLAPAVAFDVQACYRACRGNQSCQENCESRQFQGQQPSRSKEACTVRNGRRECVVKPVFE